MNNVERFDFRAELLTKTNSHGGHKLVVIPRPQTLCGIGIAILGEPEVVKGLTKVWGFRQGLKEGLIK